MRHEKVNSLFFSLYFSPYLKPHINSLHYNPLVAMNITWTEEMASDLRRGYEQGETLVPTCKHQWVSRLMDVTIKYRGL